MPTKPQSSFRLSEQTRDQLDRIADQLGKKRPEVLELAVTHLAGTLAAGQPVHLLPPGGPKSHKRSARRVA